ncbi:MIP/aquaporin family protein [Haloferula chungangensis]|uniref:MIP/aquaporin family protein n=1 Tax=Haloferula chungangensis TaxID=1048331 RepID=A0ABW2L4L3_9BACT
MTPWIAELLGTMVLILLGNGVVANVALSGTKGSASGWIVITAGWAIAVYVAVVCTADSSGAHLNPAVTVGLVAAGKFSAAKMPAYILAQFAGAMIGAALVRLTYAKHYAVSDDGDAKLATFCTGPAIRSLPNNFVSEALGTFVLVFAALSVTGGFIDLKGVETQVNAETVMVGLGSVGALPIALVVFGIGLSLGGTTGYAINPARDLGPRIVHQLLPISGKRDSDWSYAWVPVAGPVAGALIAAWLHGAVTG